ncbi:hypothetical protein LPJ63_000485 [Coemansia sp. RSA 2711]|nr:hypothetical protein LPJ63_000485 [Coemansia sp. RSA 2711]
MTSSSTSSYSTGSDTSDTEGSVEQALPLKYDKDAIGIVVHLVLASEDGTIDLGHTGADEQLLVGTTVATTVVVKGAMVAKFDTLRVQQPGCYRFRVRAVNIRDAVTHLPGPMQISNSLVNDVSRVMVINERTP